jgi:16S rRNA (guanine966-N2)-methyltransferase
VRIIAGEWKGRRIAAPRGDAVRPTLDRVREAWMSMVHADLPGARVLDLFSGSGALGLEALSRGAEHVDFVENDPRALRVLEENVRLLGAGARCTIRRDDALAFVTRLAAPAPGEPASCDVAFADPPYRRDFAVRLAELWLKRPFSAIFGVEHETVGGDPLPAGGDTRRYGDSSITIYRA